MSPRCSICSQPFRGMHAVAPDGSRAHARCLDRPGRTSRSKLGRRGMTTATKHLTREYLRSQAALLADEDFAALTDRPRERGDCEWCEICQHERDRNASSEKPDRDDVREAHDRGSHRSQDSRIGCVGGNMQLRAEDGGESIGLPNGKHDILRVLPEEARTCHEGRIFSDVPIVVRDDQAVPGCECSRLQALRREGDPCLCAVGGFSELHRGHGGAAVHDDAGPKEQFSGLRTGELSLGDIEGAGKQQALQQDPGGKRSTKNNRGVEHRDRSRLHNDSATNPGRVGVLACGHRANEVIRRSRPCVFVGCKYSLYLDVNPHTGSIKLNHPSVEPGGLAQSCALDLAATGGLTLEEVGARLNLTRERVRQVETRALLRLRGEVEEL